jgi:dTDP-4-amino-4,6-dideoxygalactose transaminase
MRSVPFYKPSIGRAEIAEVVDCIQSGWLTTGPKTKQFELEFGVYMRRRHAVAVNSCTAALHLALEAVGLRAGQRVVVPTLTFAATAEVVRYLNAVPLFADCRMNDFNLDVTHAAHQIESATAAGDEVVAIIPVHYAGQIGDVTGIRHLANKYHLRVIEDAAHCCPAYFRDDASSPWKPVGAESEVTCFSFYANKPITTGEGGMACTDSDELADRMRIMSLHGISRDAWKRYTASGSWYYEIVAPGYKYNLTDIAAAIGLHQLRKADTLHERRTLLARRYLEVLADVEELGLPQVMPDRMHSWHLFPVRLKRNMTGLDRSELISRMTQAGIGTSVHWMPLHMQPYYRQEFGWKPSDCPCAEALYPELLSLPLYPDLTIEDVEYVRDTLKDIIGKARPSFAGASLAASV